MLTQFQKGLKKAKIFLDKEEEALVFKSLKSNPRDGRLSFEVFRTALDVGNGTLRHRVRSRVAEQRRILRGDVDEEEQEEEEDVEEEEDAIHHHHHHHHLKKRRRSRIFVTVFP